MGGRGGGVSCGDIVTVLGLVGGAPVQGWGGDTARRRRDVTANAVLAVLGAGDRSRGARMRVGVLGGPWTLVRGKVQGTGFCSGPKSTQASPAKRGSAPHPLYVSA